MKTRWFFIPFVVLGLFSPQSVRAAAALDIFIDLDWTLFTPLTEPNPYVKADVASNGMLYVFTPKAAEVIYALSRLPNARISFFSGGPEERNLSVLKNLKLPNGQTAFDLAQGRTFHFQHLVSLKPLPPGDPEEIKALFLSGKAKFSDYFRKNLLRVLPADGSLSRTLLIDDIRNFAALGQEKNVLWTQESYHYLPTYRAWRENRAGHSEHPKDWREWYRGTQKLVWALGAIDAALFRLSYSGEDFLSALRSVLDEPEGAPLRRLSPQGDALLKRGENILRRQKRERRCEDLLTI